jgi:hypothetical protein
MQNIYELETELVREWVKSLPEGERASLEAQEFIWEKNFPWLAGKGGQK